MSLKSESRLLTTRRGFVGLCGGAAAALYSPTAFGAAKPSWERALSFDNIHTGERLTRVYWAEGRYIPQALAEINYILRDHRSGEVAAISTRLLDVLHGLHSTLGSSAPFQIISGYRSPETNAAMRDAGRRGVAKRSYHMEGMAIDVAVENRPVDILRRAALSLNAGGVGYYPKSGFVHVDVGPPRSW